MFKLLLAFASFALVLLLPTWIKSPEGSPYLVTQPNSFQHISSFTHSYNDIMVSVSAKMTPKDEKVNVFAWQDAQGNMHFSDQAQTHSFQKSQTYEVTDHFNGRFSFPDYWVWACMFVVWLLFYVAALLVTSGLARAYHAIRNVKEGSPAINQKAPAQEKEYHYIDYEKADSSLTSAYKILGVSSTATAEEIKTAYRNKIKQYHPDKVANLGKELQDVARKKSSEVNRAYEMLQSRKTG